MPLAKNCTLLQQQRVCTLLATEGMQVDRIATRLRLPDDPQILPGDSLVLRKQAGN